MSLTKKIYLCAQVNDNFCCGDKICENICVTKAVNVVEKKAVVDVARCLGCRRCMDVCPNDAIEMVHREEPLSISLNTEDVDPEELRKLCEKAHLRPNDIICICTITTARDIAAAVLKGAKTPEDVSLMTGVRSSCGMWCMTPILRVLNANGVDFPESDNYRWYNIKVDLWNTQENVDKKYPEYRLKEDKELFQKGIFHNLPGH